MTIFRLVAAVVTTASLLVPWACLAADAGPAKAPTAAASSLPDPVARVNGKAIAAADLQKAYRALAAGQQVPAGKEQEARLFVLNQLINAEMLYQLAQNTPVSELDKKVQESINRLKGRFKDEQAFRTGLAQQELTEADLRELVRRNAVIENHIETTIASKVTVSEQEIREFYDKNPETFTMPEQVRASHILVSVAEKASDTERKQARAKAEQLLQQVKAGADFAKLAQEHSGCPSSKQGGDLGYFGKGQMVKPFEDAAWALKPGELSGLVETPYGFHIIKLTERRAKDKMPFDALKERIGESLKQRRISEQVNAALEAARTTAKIELLLK